VHESNKASLVSCPTMNGSQTVSICSDDYDMSHGDDFDDSSSDCTMRLQIPDSPTERVQSAWTDLSVDTLTSECARRSATDLNQHYIGSESRQPGTLGPAQRLTVGDVLSRDEHVLAVSKTVAVDAQGMDEGHGRSLIIDGRHRPSSASSSSS